MGRTIQFMHSGDDLSNPTIDNIAEWKRKAKDKDVVHSSKY